MELTQAQIKVLAVWNFTTVPRRHSSVSRTVPRYGIQKKDSHEGKVCVYSFAIL